LRNGQGAAAALRRRLQKWPLLAHRYRDAPPQAARRPGQGNLAAQQGEQQHSSPGQRPHRAGQPARQIRPGLGQGQL
nr:hypothetical protein [Tanacetum cinerariifolium]